MFIFWRSRPRVRDTSPGLFPWYTEVVLTAVPALMVILYLWWWIVVPLVILALVAAILWLYTKPQSIDEQVDDFFYPEESSAKNKLKNIFKE